MKRIFNLATLAILSTIGFGTAYATQTSKNDALSIETAKVGLSQAVASAEQHIGGKATRAEYEQHKGKWVFEVEVIKARKVMDVTIDATSGKILASVENHIDLEDEHERPD